MLRMFLFLRFYTSKAEVLSEQSAFEAASKLGVSSIKGVVKINQCHQCDQSDQSNEIDFKKYLQHRESSKKCSDKEIEMNEEELSKSSAIY